MALARQVREALGGDAGMVLLAGAMRMQGSSTLTVGGPIAGAVLSGAASLTFGDARHVTTSTVITGITAAAATATTRTAEVTVTPDVGELVSKAAREASPASASCSS